VHDHCTWEAFDVEAAKQQEYARGKERKKLEEHYTEGLASVLERGGAGAWGARNTEVTTDADAHILAIHRLYAKARILGYTRGKRNQKPTTSLVQIEGVANKEEADFYLGKVCLG
jgi:hypothetical protein